MPSASGHFDPKRRAEQPGRRARTKHQQRAGQQVEAGHGRGRPEAVAEPLGYLVGQPPRRLHEPRDEDERPEHREAGDECRDVRQQHRPLREHADVDQRFVDVELEHDPEHGADGRESEQPEHRRRRPSPALALGEREQERDQHDGHQHRAGHVDARSRAHGRFGDESAHEHDRDRDPDRPDNEEPAPARVVDDHARQDEPEAAADAEHGRKEADPHLDPLGAGTRRG